MNKESVVSALNWVSLRLGYSHPKPAQAEAVTTFILGIDVFLSLPTGYGKSLCYYCTLAYRWVFDMIKQKIAFSVIIVVDIGGDNLMDYRYAL